MNGEPLRPDHGAPFRMIVPHWYAVASVKWLKRIDVLTEPYAGEFQTGHYMYEWPDRPHEARQPHARARSHHRPGARRRCISRGTHTVRGKAWSGTGPVTRRRCQLHRRGRLARGEARAAQGAVPVAGVVVRVGGRTTSDGTRSAPRATDAAGNVQPDVPPWNRLGYGNNAIEVIYVDITS